MVWNTNYVDIIHRCKCELKNNMLLKTALRGNKIRINTYNSGNPFGILSGIYQYASVKKD